MPRPPLLPSVPQALRLSALLALALALLVPRFVSAQEARQRWDRLCQIRREKFDLVLPEAMRSSHIDIWIVAQKENHPDPLYDILGRGYTGRVGYYVFSDRGGDRVERVALGIEGGMLEGCAAYDRVGDAAELKAFLAERNPRRIGINVSEQIGMADGLSWSSRRQLEAAIGEPWVSRLVPAEALVSEFLSRHTAGEVAAFAEAGELARQLAERALSNEVITPGRTTLADVAWWMSDQLLQRGLESSFDMPSVYITGPDGIEATSNDRIIQRGEILVIDWGVGYLNQFTDMKRMAYVLKEGEREIPAGFRHAFDQAVKVRDLLKRTIRPGPTAAQMLETLTTEIERAGFSYMKEFNRPSAGPATDVIIGCHSVGDRGHGSGPSIAFFNPTQLTFPIVATNFFSIELFAYTPVPEWGGRKLRVPLEDDAVVTERGVEWVYPANPAILAIK
jgi:Xaa-Pro aminopeptidase